MKRLFLVSFIVVLSLQTEAEQSTANTRRPEVMESTPITIGKEVSFRSEILSRDVSLNIYLPDSFHISSEEHTYPIVFSNGGHGYQFFSTLVGMVQHLGDRELMPESIVVSLNDMNGIPDVFTNGMWSREKIEGAGDAEQSIRFLEEELIPYLENSYRANDFRIIIGVSGSSLFPIHTFLQTPDLFDSHILIAAADMIGMGYKSGQTFVDAFEKALAKTPKRKRNLYVGVADSDLENHEEYRQNLDDLTTRLSRFEGLDVRAEVFPNADHYAVFIKAILSAFDQSFPKNLWSSRYRDLVAQPGDALENIDRYYEDLSEEYGFRVLPRADRWNNVNCLRFMVRHLIREKRTKEAITVAKRGIKYRPTSSAPFGWLADAYEADGRLGEAIEAQQKAVDLARAGADADISFFEERLRSLKEI